MKPRFTAIVQRDGEWWIGWVKEIPGVNAQERSREELMQSLSEALADVLELNARQAMESVRGQYEEIVLPA